MAMERLSKLQKWILLRIHYSESEYIKRRDIYKEYWKLNIPDQKEIPASKYKPVEKKLRVSLSRSIIRLEERDYVRSEGRTWDIRGYDDDITLNEKGKIKVRELEKNLRDLGIDILRFLKNGMS